MGLKLEYADGQTPLSEEEKDGLKLRGVTTHGELNEQEQLNIEDALLWLYALRIKPSRLLSEVFLKELHKRMFNNVWVWAGQYRKSEKNIGVNCYRIHVEVKNLLDDLKYWIEKEVFPPDEICLRFKHRLVSIHCFPNGNGRHSRLMADVLREKLFFKKPFGWRQSEIHKPNQVRSRYIMALKAADSGNIEPLLNFARAV